MKRTIHKYTIEAMGEQHIEMPEGAHILCAQMQHGVPQLWAIVDPSMPSRRRDIRVYGTGHPVEDGEHRYLGTLQTHGGALVFHVFEREIGA
jgi:hypothetical protein